MNILVLSLLFSCVLLSALARNPKSLEDLAQSYLKELQDSNYDRRIAPEGSAGPGAPVNIKVSMYILDLYKVDGENMEFEGQFYFRQSWNDSRLQFKDKNIEYVILKSIEEIWTPDLFFVEEKEGLLHKIIHPNIFVKISPNGEVLFSVRLSMKFGCHLDLRKYPHDIQTCSISVESYGYTRKHIEIEWNESNPYKPLNAADKLSLIDFDVIDLVPSTEHIVLNSGGYSRLLVTLKFQRKIGYFATRVYIPFVLLVTLSWLSLWIRSEEKSIRLGLLLVILYLMFTISHEANEGVPPVSYTKASDVWIGFCESLVFAIFLEYILVYLMLKRELLSAGKGELLPSIDTEAKEDNMSTNSTKSPLSKFLNMMDARKGVKNPASYLSYRIDFICRILVPIVFTVFNVVYWSVYA